MHKKQLSVQIIKSLNKYAFHFFCYRVKEQIPPSDFLLQLRLEFLEQNHGNTFLMEVLN
ncbi:MAG: hypothetical protein M0Q21_01335 [Ignavibacteriaceae bacterium]|nr:hypothetical protein [Ignavibacteriaceae bacterium]